MSNPVVSDAGAGRALLLTRLKLTVHAASMSLWAGALPGLLLPLVLWIGWLTPTDSDLLKQTFVSHVVSESTARKWPIRDVHGAENMLTVIKADGTPVQRLTPAQFRSVTRNLSPVIGAFSKVLVASFVGAILGYVLMWRSLTKIGKKARQNKVIRGAEDIVSPQRLSTIVRRKDPGPYKILDVWLPSKAAMRGILFQGAQGTGKSLGQHDLMQQVFARRRKCFIYDQSGEYFRAYFRPGKDYFFNPAMLGCVPWSIFEELVNSYDSNTLGQAFLPPKAGVVHGANAFFEDAARALFSVMLLRLAQRGAVHTCVIAEAILSMPDDELELLIQESVASSAIGGDSKGQRQGVISSIAIYLDGIAAVPEGNWSIREFIERDDDARFFILGTDDTKAMFAPLYRLLLTVAFGAIAAKQEIVHEDRYWFFLDEAHTLGDIKLDEHQATLRKYGVCVVSGIQSDKQYFTSMGQDRGETLLNCFNTVVMLRANEPNMAKRMADRLTKREMEVVTEGQAVAVTEWRDGAQINQGEQEKWLVMPGQISNLDDCVAYLRLPGKFPVALVDYQHWLPKWWRPWARVSRFKEIQDNPPRDPRFKIQRASEQDALASVRADAEKARAERAAAEEAKVAVEAGGVWLVNDETGELTKVDEHARQAAQNAQSETAAPSDGEGGSNAPKVEASGLFTRPVGTRKNNENGDAW